MVKISSALVFYRWLMDTFLLMLLAFLEVIWEGLSAAFGWVVDHFFEIAVLYAVFFYLPRCMALIRVDSGEFSRIHTKLDEVARQLDELNSKVLDPDDIDEDLPPPMYKNDSAPEPKKPTKPYPY